MGLVLLRVEGESIIRMAAEEPTKFETSEYNGLVFGCVENPVGVSKAPRLIHVNCVSPVTTCLVEEHHFPERLLLHDRL